MFKLTENTMRHTLEKEPQGGPHGFDTLKFSLDGAVTFGTVYRATGLNFGVSQVPSGHCRKYED